MSLGILVMFRNGLPYEASLAASLSSGTSTIFIQSYMFPVKQSRLER